MPRRGANRVVLAVAAAVCTYAALALKDLDWQHVWQPVGGGVGGRSQTYSIRSVGDAILGLFNRWLESMGERAEFRERMLRTQSVRQRRLAEGCVALTMWKSSVGDRMKSRNRRSLVINVPSPLGVTYCAIPKCGTTTWLHFFEDTTGNTCNSAWVHNCARVKFYRPSSVGDYHPISIVVVRDPWRRLVSAYEDKFVAHRHPLAASCFLRNNKSLSDDKSVTFSEFVRCILTEYRRGRELNAHYAPQHWQCSFCQANYSYVATVETLADDFRYLATYVFPRGKYKGYLNSFLTGRRRPTELRNVTSLVYEDRYRSLKPADMAALVRLYRHDAVLFGYSLQPLP